MPVAKNLEGPSMMYSMWLHKFSFCLGLRMLELLKFAERYPIMDSPSCSNIKVGQASYFSPASTAPYVSSQGYPSSKPQAHGWDGFQSVRSTDQSLIQYKKVPTESLPCPTCPHRSKSQKEESIQLQLIGLIAF
jgi:hypothetical protein